MSQTSGPAPRLDVWEIIGPGGGGGQFNPAVSPHDPDLVFNRCDMGGAYVSYDGGDSWRMFNLRCWAPFIGFDPGSPDVVYAGNMGLWRSEDRGVTWSLLLPDPARNTVEHWSDDHADVSFTSDDPFYPGPDTRIDAIAVSPANSDHLYLSLKCTTHLPVQGCPAMLYFSPDRGKTWRKLADLEAAPTFVLHVTKDSRVFVAQPSGLLLCEGHSCTRLPGPEGERIITAAIGEQEGKVLVYAFIATSWEGTNLNGLLYVSEDEGRTWRGTVEGVLPYLDLPGEGTPPTSKVVACCARQAATAYLGLQGNYHYQKQLSRFNGVLKTTDAGHTWQVVHREANAPSDNLDATYLEERAAVGNDPSIWFDTPLTMGVAPSDPDLCFVSDYFRTIRTRDGGKAWTSCYSVKVGKNAWRTRGLDVTTCYGVHFDPSDRKKMFISYTDIGGFRSEDGGHSWIGATEGIPPDWRNTTYWVEYDPEVPGLLWGAYGLNHDLPRPRMWARRSPAEYRGGVAVSTDHGATWSLSNDGMAQTAVTHLVLDPASPVGRRTLYAAGFGTGVWKSTDNGATWSLKNTGLEGDVPLAWRLARVADGTLYLLLARRVADGEDSIGGPDDGALYKSTDGAETWQRMRLPDGCNGPNGLAVDPTDPRRLYLAAWARFARPDDISGGVFLSTDGGETWRNVLSRLQHAYDVTLDPRNPNLVYVCGFNTSAYRSADKGQTWSRLKGYTFKDGHRVIPDPYDAGKVYITTFGGSVWHGPAEGDPEAVEDIITPIRLAAE